MDQLNEIKQLVNVFNDLCRYRTNKTNNDMSEQFRHVFGYYVLPVVDLDINLRHKISNEFKLLEAQYKEYSNTYENHLQLKNRCNKFHDLFAMNKEIVSFYENLPEKLNPSKLCLQWKNEIDLYCNHCGILNNKHKSRQPIFVQ